MIRESPKIIHKYIVHFLLRKNILSRDFFFILECLIGMCIIHSFNNYHLLIGNVLMILMGIYLLIFICYLI